MSDFALHPQLAADTHAVAEWALSSVRLLDDARFPWIVLVPRRADAREIHRLAAADREELLREIVRASEALEEVAAPDKLNVGALGNLVPQLHVHVVGRRVGDAAWPGPVWGVPGREPYAPARVASWIQRFTSASGG